MLPYVRTILGEKQHPCSRRQNQRTLDSIYAAKTSSVLATNQLQVTTYLEQEILQLNCGRCSMIFQLIEDLLVVVEPLDMILFGEHQQVLISEGLMLLLTILSPGHLLLEFGIILYIVAQELV